MTKQEFIQKVATKSGLSSRDAGKAVDAFMETVTETLKAGDTVNFTGFGKFSPSARAARKGVNPRTGERVQIAATTVPKFWPAASSRPRSRAESTAPVRCLTPHGVRHQPAAVRRRDVVTVQARWPSPRRSPSPTGSPPRSSASASSSSSGSTRVDLLPVELRGDVARFCCGIDRRRRPARGRGQAAARVLRGARARRAWRRSTRSCAYARRAGLLVIADGKRGDIGSTARAYAAAYLEGDAAARRRAHRQPVARPRLGRAVPRRGAPRRRRASSCIVQDLERGRRPAGRRRSRTAARCGSTSPRSSTSGARHSSASVGLTRVGAVVGATHPRAVAEARKLMPQVDPAPARASARRAATVGRPGARVQSGPASALVNASRSVNYAFRESGADLPRGRGRRGGAAASRRSGPPPVGSAPATTGAATSPRRRSCSLRRSPSC